MKKRRLVGLDVCRGLAAYGVVFLHSGDKSWGTLSYWASISRSLFNFAVPFFLATSFYLIIQKLPIGWNKKFWKSKLDRLLIPYIVWSIIYIIFKSLIFLVLKQNNKLNQLLQDPIALIFFGGSAIQLYFLPLLLIGTFTIILIADPLAEKQIKQWKLGLLLILSIILNEILLSTGNSFDLGNNIAFTNLVSQISPKLNNNAIIRVLLVYISWMFRCISYILIAMLLTPIIPKLQLKFNRRFIAFIALLLFFISSFLNIGIFSNYFNNLIRAFTLLIFGIFISEDLKENRIIINLAQCSFGIYLIHPFFINIMEVVAKIFLPQIMKGASLFSQILFSVPSFLISWVAVYFLIKNKLFARYMFGTYKSN